MDTDFSDLHLDIPLDKGVHLVRNPGDRMTPGARTYTNVPHLVVHHSPTGFEWGYGGSGPADLALNIAEAILQRTGYKGERMRCYDGDCFTLAWQLHQGLKSEFIAPMPDAGGVISYGALHGWILVEAIRLRIPNEPQPTEPDYGLDETPTD